MVVSAAYPAAQQNANDSLFQGDLKSIYPEYLILLHQIIRCSVPLMQSAVSQLSELAEKTSAQERFLDYLVTHIREEAEHDRWLLSDLAAIGYNESEVFNPIPPSEVAQLVGAQYYWILHDSPFSLLGYIAVLEGAPPSSAKIDRMQTETGFPSEAFRTLRVHSDVDQDHLRELDVLLDELPVTERDRHAILSSAAITVLGVAKCFASLRRLKYPISTNKKPTLASA